MWYPAKVTTPPTEPVSVEEAKRQCNCFHDDDDAYFEGLIASARDHVERYLGTPVAEQTVEVKCDSFADFTRLSVAPVSDADVAYIDASGQDQTMADSVLELRADGLEASIVLKYGQTWPAIQIGSRIVVTAVVGYEEIPPSIKHAMLLWISEAYDNRENGKYPEWTAFDALLCNYRRR